MIRTGIYDGYTPGPWKLDDRIWEMYLGLEPDVMLMQDAPLLLEEVKRLRGELESIENDMAWTVQVWQNENYMGRQDWMEQMCEIYTDLAKGIEAQYYGDDEE